MDSIYSVISAIILFCGIVIYSHGYLLCLRSCKKDRKIESQGVLLAVFIFISCVSLLTSGVTHDLFMYIGSVLGLIGVLSGAYYYRERKKRLAGSIKPHKKARKKGYKV